MILDLCYRCVDAIYSDYYPSRTANGIEINGLNSTIIQGIMSGETTIYGLEGKRFDMIASCTIAGSRVCATHVENEMSTPPAPPYNPYTNYGRSTPLKGRR